MNNTQTYQNQSKQIRRTHQRPNRGHSQQTSSARNSQFSTGYPKPISRTSVIKVNKAKLPPDFFPKSWSFQKKLPHFKLSILQQQPQIPFPYRKRVESEHLHISPQKTSFFGFFDNNSTTKQINGNSGSNKKIAIKRKFETRQQTKRQNLNLQNKRRFTPGSHTQRNDLIDLFPPQSNQQMTDIIISNASMVRSGKMSPRKQHMTRLRENQPIQDPQKFNQKLKERTAIIEEFNYNITPKKNLNMNTIDKGKQEKTFSEIDLHNMTFFNAKSSCLPPIKKS